MQSQFASIVADAFADLGSGTLSQTEFSKHLKAANESARQALFAHYQSHPFETRDFIGAISLLTDAAVSKAFEFACGQVGINDPDTVAVLAVGGCGRAEMAPFSDVDLLFLVRNSTDPLITQTVETTLYILWDLKLKVGHATRSVSETLKLSQSDITIRTSVLENRLITGDAKLHQNLNATLRSQLFSKTASEFVEEKLLEREQRHTRNGGARYVLEPNVKEGKGGLRDLQTLFWITKYISDATTPLEMAQAGYFSNDEMQAFVDAEAFLWTVRCHLHLNAGRAVEKLTFDQQADISKTLGYEDGAGRLAVERFMQDFFRHATTVGDLTRILLTALEATHVKAQPTFKQRISDLFSLSKTDAAPDGYMIEHGRLNISNPDSFLRNPINILRIFDTALESEVLIHPNAMRVISANLHLITAELRSDPEAQELFLQVLIDRNNPERALRRMNELGVLGKFIPEFERIIAMMQFNYYHQYTVDEHIIQCLSNLAKIERGEAAKDYPIVTKILKKGINRRVLYVALLLHDIGKGLPEAHEIIGEEMARKIAPQLSLEEGETELVAWLVRNHLLMSDVAQRRDITDPKTVRDFAENVQSVQRLDLLTVLTVCDILGVGPGTLTAWKAELLRQLYNTTRRVLRDGSPDAAIEDRVATNKSNLGELLGDWSKEERELELSRHYDDYWIGMDTDTHVALAESLRRLAPEGIEIDADLDGNRDITRICFSLQDHPGIFSRLSGAVALAGVNVVDARTYTTRDGFAVAVFWVQGTDRRAIRETRKLERLKEIIYKTLTGKLVARQEMKSKDKIAKREKDMQVATEITFDNDGSEVHTIIEVDTRDRPGLLYDLTRTLADANIRISSARIATYGAQAVDTFYVKDIFGLKIRSKQKQASIASNLKSAIQAGTEQALPQ